jgi:two-component system copper resistance phosphate regulon response regulator CusR
MKAPSLRVLIVDDDPELCRVLEIGLAESGLTSGTALDGDGALKQLAESPAGHYDLILLDLVMPGKDGWQLLEALREAGRDIPVIVVSAKDKAEDKVRCLRLGADDYVVKPFLIDEIVERIAAVVRRRRALSPIEIGDLRLDLAQRRVIRSGKPVALSPREFDLLMVLSRAKGEVISREDLLREVWDITFDPGTNLLDVHLGRLRKKIDRHGRPAIQNVRGEGYRLVMENLTHI